MPSHLPKPDVPSDDGTPTSVSAARRRLLLKGAKTAPVVLLSTKSLNALAVNPTGCSVMMSVTVLNSHGHANFQYDSQTQTGTYDDGSGTKTTFSKSGGAITYTTTTTANNQTTTGQCQ